MATVTGEPIRSKTLKYVEHLANRWKYTTMQDGWKDDEDGNPTPSEVMEVVTGRSNKHMNSYSVCFNMNYDVERYCHCFYA